MPLSGTDSLLPEVTFAYNTISVGCGFHPLLFDHARATAQPTQFQRRVNGAPTPGQRSPRSLLNLFRTEKEAFASGRTQWHRPGSGQIDTIRVEEFFEMVEVHLYDVTYPLGSKGCRLRSRQAD